MSPSSPHLPLRPLFFTLVFRQDFVKNYIVAYNTTVHTYLHYCQLPSSSSSIPSYRHLQLSTSAYLTPFPPPCHSPSSFCYYLLPPPAHLLPRLIRLVTCPLPHHSISTPSSPLTPKPLLVLHAPARHVTPISHASRILVLVPHHFFPKPLSSAHPNHVPWMHHSLYSHAPKPHSKVTRRRHWRVWHCRRHRMSRSQKPVQSVICCRSVYLVRERW